VKIVGRGPADKAVPNAAKALGIEVPSGLLVIADEVIE
jgi:hypothetical protein